MKNTDLRNEQVWLAVGSLMILATVALAGARLHARFHDPVRAGDLYHRGGCSAGRLPGDSLALPGWIAVLTTLLVVLVLLALLGSWSSWPFKR